MASDVMESGHWRVSIARAEAVIGHPVHFHRRKAEAAFLSGTITGYRREPYITEKGRTSTRTIFVFSPQPETHATTDVTGWTLAGVKFVP
ncbi:hypothetical protein [Haloferula chungangensis]|uniref:hypothetical protein n=1 Tax=Haloferula chungangensis TaxID=1048331 RepID=UPI0036D21945